jgi:L-alanine-DL-glutamate epimerase-like enolase superfamily enzyme
MTWSKECAKADYSERISLRVSEKPGLGVNLNEEVARRYARPDEPFS